MISPSPLFCQAVREILSLLVVLRGPAVLHFQDNLSFLADPDRLRLSLYPPDLVVLAYQELQVVLEDLQYLKNQTK